MNIRPKNTILFAYTGVKFSLDNLGGANWRQQVFNNYRLHLLDLLTKYGEAEDYGNWLNEMLSRHANLYKSAGTNWENEAYKNDLVGQYQLDYRGGLGNDGQYKRFGLVSINSDDRYDFNQGISPNYNTRYNILNPPTRTSQDRLGMFKVDNLYSAITDDRRLLGRKGDWDETSEDYKQWLKELNSRGWETYLDTNDNYYKLRRLNSSQETPNNSILEENPDSNKKGTLPVGQHQETYGFDWNKIGQGLLKILGNPELLAAGRLAGNLINNAKVYDEQIKGISPVLRLTYNTHRQVVGDEATKQAYYRRAAQGQSRAARPFTSDADRQMAYQMEAKRIGDELRALGDLADNQEIRRTSDESNQHQWANQQRATEVANANLASINLANAAKHNLLALKHSAQWSSVDNFLKEIEYRKRLKLAEERALNDQIYTLTRAGEIENDKELLDLKSQFEAASKKPENQKDSFGLKVINYDAKEIKDLINRIKDRLILLLIETLKNRPRYNSFSLNYKSGGKVVRKKKDDLLYKSAKDVVEHFRKMSKLSSDSLNRKTPKIEKLTSHPKTKKYQYGGTAPFTVYTPVAMGGETTRSAEYDSSSRASSSKDNEGKETLDLVKNLFKEVLGKGLPVDINSIYANLNNLFSKYKAFGNEMDTNDIALLYLQSMLSINNAMHSKLIYDKAQAYATQNDALGEFAVNALGHFIVQDTETGQISTEKSWKDVLSSGKNPITNEQLLYLRAYNPELASARGDYMIQNVISNGMGINKIAALIKDLAGSIGTNEGKIEGLTQVESGKVKAGLQLLANAPDGYYKTTNYTKDLQVQVRAALSYIKNMLSPALKATLEVHGGIDENIRLFLGSQEDFTREVTFSPLTGKASDKDEKDSSEKIKSNPLMQLILGEGGVPRTWNLITKDSNVKMSVDGIEYSQLPKITEDMSLDKMLSESGIAGILDSKLGITFGDLNISPDLLKDIMYSNSGGMVVTLPCKIVNGHKEVNLGVKKTYEEAIQEVESKGISKNSSEYYKILGEVLKQKGLNSLLDSNGYPDRNKFGLFLVVEAYTTDKIKNLDTSSQYIEKVKNPDALLEERMIKALSTDSKKNNYNLDIDYWLYGDDVYRGTVFIPLSNNLNAANNAWGSLISVENARELENKFQNFNKASNMKSSNSDVL